jgi:ankyrin repeat protein
MRTAPEVSSMSTRLPSSGLPEERAKQSELMVACAAGKLTVVRRLLAAGAELDYINAFGETPLTYAVAAQREGVARHLLAQGANVELPQRPAWSPLLYAAATGNLPLLSALLDKGADVTRLDHEGRSAVDIARKAGHFRSVALLELRMALATTMDGVRQAEATTRASARGRDTSHLRHRPRGAVRSLPIQ